MIGGAETAVADIQRVLGGYCSVGNFIDDHPYLAAAIIALIIVVLWKTLGCSSPKVSKFFDDTLPSGFDDLLPSGFSDSWVQGVDHRFSSPSYMSDSYTQIPLRYR